MEPTASRHVTVQQVAPVGRILENAAMALVTRHTSGLIANVQVRWFLIGSLRYYNQLLWHSFTLNLS